MTAMIDRLEEVLTSCRKEGACWLRGREGCYPTIYIDGKARRAHVMVYERFKGKVPDGLEIDHVCNNKHCLNPEHLEAVTHAENVRRAWAFYKANPDFETSLLNVRLDKKAEAQRRAREDFRGNLTAYINALIKADILKHHDRRAKPKGKTKPHRGK